MHVSHHGTALQGGSKNFVSPLRPLPLKRVFGLSRDRKATHCSVWWQWGKRAENSETDLAEESRTASRNSAENGRVSQNGSNSPSERDSDYIIQNVMSLDQISKEEWNRCLSSSSEGNPFISYEFLNTLEQSGCATRSTGWLPYHLTLRRTKDSKLIGCCPLYIKSHSQGEYVFDHQWAQASAYYGTRYYPKLQSCVPFTPVTGSRFLVSPDGQDDASAIRKTLAEGLKAVADSINVSSAHLTFNPEEESQLLEEEGYISRMGLQYHWENQQYATFDEFLMELRQSKRKNIRQERKSVKKADLRVERLIGDDIKSHHWDLFYEFYRDTCDRKWGEAYLNREFFHMIGETMNGRILLVLAKNTVDDYVAGAWNCVGSHALFGRNWGKRRSFDCKHLHFELCYYQALEAAIEMGLSRVEAGAQGEHKMQRGYLPRPTFSSHYIRSDEMRRRIRQSTELERLRLTEAIDYMNGNYSPFK